MQINSGNSGGPAFNEQASNARYFERRHQAGLFPNISINLVCLSAFRASALVLPFSLSSTRMQRTSGTSFLRR